MNKDGIINEYERLQTEVDSIIEISGILNVLDNSSGLDEDECFDINLILSNTYVNKEPCINKYPNKGVNTPERYNKFVHNNSHKMAIPRKGKLIPQSYSLKKQRTIKFSKIFSFLF